MSKFNVYGMLIYTVYMYQSCSCTNVDSRGCTAKTFANLKKYFDNSADSLKENISSLIISV